jgi:hypothetical protein
MPISSDIIVCSIKSLSNLIWNITRFREIFEEFVLCPAAILLHINQGKHISEKDFNNFQGIQIKCPDLLIVKMLYFLQLSSSRNKFTTMTCTSPNYMCFVLSKLGDELRNCNNF